MTQDGTWSDESEWEIPDSGFDDTVEDAGPPPVTANVRAFRVLVRNAMFRRVELAALRKWQELAELDGASKVGRAS